MADTDKKPHALESFKRLQYWLLCRSGIIKLFVLACLFFYSLFPLGRLQPNLARSLDSIPLSTPFTFMVQLLIVGIAVFCCFACFKKLPLGIVSLIEKVLSWFYGLNMKCFIGLLLMSTFLVTGVIAYTVLDHIPHVQDSIAQLFQAKIFALGKLYAPLPPHEEFFYYDNIIYADGKWYSQYPPGHPLLLTLGLFLGVPWLVGPLLGTLSLCVFFLLIKTIYRDHQMLYLSCMLLFFSPFFIFMSSNHMNHNSTLLCILLFLYWYVQVFSSQRSLYSILSGLALGYAINIRPLCAVSIAAPFICYMLICAFIRKEIATKKILYFFTTVSLMIFLLLLYNTLTTGHPLLFGYYKKYNTFGFLGSAQMGPPHSMLGGVINSNNNLVALNEYLFEWHIPSLIFIFILFLLPLKKSRWDYLSLLACLSLIISYFFYYYQDLCFGPRLYYCTLPFIIILSVRGFSELPYWLAAKGFDRRRVEVSLYLVLCLCFLDTFFFSFPVLIKKYSNDYWSVTDKIHSAVKKRGITNAVVLIDAWYPPQITGPNPLLYGSGFLYNSPDLTDDIIYAIDLKGKNSELMQDFPGREFYLCKFYSPMSGFTLQKLDSEGARAVR